MTSNISGQTLAWKDSVEGVDHGVKNRGLARTCWPSNGEHSVLAEFDEINLHHFGIRAEGFNRELERSHASTSLMS